MSGQRLTGTQGFPLKTLPPGNTDWQRPAFFLPCRRCKQALPAHRVFSRAAILRSKLLDRTVHYRDTRRQSPAKYRDRVALCFWREPGVAWRPQDGRAADKLEPTTGRCAEKIAAQQRDEVARPPAADQSSSRARRQAAMRLHL